MKHQHSSKLIINCTAANREKKSSAVLTQAAVSGRLCTTWMFFWDIKGFYLLGVFLDSLGLWKDSRENWLAISEAPSQKHPNALYIAAVMWGSVRCDKWLNTMKNDAEEVSRTPERVLFSQCRIFSQNEQMNPQHVNESLHVHSRTFPHISDIRFAVLSAVKHCLMVSDHLQLTSDKNYKRETTLEYFL